MDLYKLNPTTYLPTNLIDGYSSLIWTERYSNLGEFEMRSPLIEEHLAALPEDTLVSHRETREVFVVDALYIDRDDDGNRELVVKGISFESILGDRQLISGGNVFGEPWRLPYSYSAADACALVICDVLNNPSSRELTSNTVVARDSTRENLPNFGAGVKDSRTPVVVSEWWAEAGDAYALVQDWLSRRNLGIRNVRPIVETDANAWSFSKVAMNGVFTVASDPDQSSLKLRMVPYYGVDRRRGNVDGNASVTFQYDDGDLSDPKYIFSTRGLKNICEVNSSVGSVTVYTDAAVSPFLTGRNRRVMRVDAGTHDVNDAAWQGNMTQKGEIELAKYNRQQLFDAEIAETTPYKYKTHYDLGDKVSLFAEFGFKPTMMVNEYVRIEDEEGDRGYPTLILAV